jgi:hypothetical protein
MLIQQYQLSLIAVTSNKLSSTHLKESSMKKETFFSVNPKSQKSDEALF